MNNKPEIAVYTGRLCPIHLWHECHINSMRDRFNSRFLQVLWSSNAQPSLRNFFNYEERRAFIKALFPDQKIVWLPDYSTDSEWLVALDDLIIAFAWFESKEELLDKTVFVGWCEEDVDFFYQDWRKVEIINRFDGSTPKISATEVRDALIHSRSLDGLVNPKIQEEVKTLFASKWEKFKKI